MYTRSIYAKGSQNTQFWRKKSKKILKFFFLKKNSCNYFFRQMALPTILVGFFGNSATKSEYSKHDFKSCRVSRVPRPRFSDVQPCSRTWSADSTDLLRGFHRAAPRVPQIPRICSVDSTDMFPGFHGTVPRIPRTCSADSTDLSPDPMDLISGFHGPVPRTPWTCAADSTDRFRGFHGPVPWIPRTYSMCSKRHFSESAELFRGSHEPVLRIP